MKRRHSRHLARFAWVVVLGGLLIAALHPAMTLGQDEDDELSDSLAGTFTIILTEVDVPQGLAGGPSLLGQWTLAFADDGTFTMTRQDVGPLVTGSYEVDGDTLMITDETGILACGGGVDVDPDLSVGSYELSRNSDDGGLTLTPIEEPCETRRILLSTRTLSGFEACRVEPLSASGRRPDATDAEATEEPDESDTALPGKEATPVADDDDDDDDGDAADEPPTGLEEEIDALLKQATGCWAAGDPARFLALHSDAVLDEIRQGGSLADFFTILEPAMADPLVFERLGNVEEEGEDRAAADIVIRIGEEGFLQRFEFVREDGRWLIDNFFLFEVGV